MQVQVLGAGRDVGRSCLLVKTAKTQLLLDCGAHPAYADTRRFPDFSSIDVNSLDAILITHFHLDHAAALPYLTETLKCPSPIYMTAPTKPLTRLMLHDFITTSTNRNQYLPFQSNDIESCLQKVRYLHLDQTTTIADKIRVTCYYAGHALGSVMLDIQVDGLSVLYSGDYSTRPDRHLKAAHVPYGLSPDLFITEATYCSQVRKETKVAQEDEFLNAVIETITMGGKILVPISAFGRVQAVCGILENHPDSDLLKTLPMYIVTGLASKANDIYTQFTDWTVQGTYKPSLSDKQNETNAQDRTPPPSFLANLQSFNKNEHWHLLHIRTPMILFATPGTMSTGLSRDVFRLWAGDPRNLVVVPGYTFSNSLASKLSSGDNLNNDAGVDVKCRLINMAFNSHVDARGIVRMCRKVMPRAVMLVHGDGPKINEFQKHISSQLGIKCFAPSNDETVSFDPTSFSRPMPHDSKETAQVSQVSSEWQSLIDAYSSGIQSQTEQSVR